MQLSYQLKNNKFNNNKINSLRIYGIAYNYKILHEVLQRLSQHNLKISNHRHIQKFRQRKQWFK
jgi:hypothetical protein